VTTLIRGMLGWTILAGILCFVGSLINGQPPSWEGFRVVWWVIAGIDVFISLVRWGWKENDW